jgi:hypothetical protein
VVDATAHGIAPHQPGIVRLQQLGRSAPIVHAGVQPQIMGFLPALKADGPAIAVSGDDINSAWPARPARRISDGGGVVVVVAVMMGGFGNLVFGHTQAWNLFVVYNRVFSCA